MFDIEKSDERLKELDDDVEKGMSTFLVLLDDAGRCFDLFSENYYGDQEAKETWMTQYVRAVFAAIDAMFEMWRNAFAKFLVEIEQIHSNRPAEEVRKLTALLNATDEEETVVNDKGHPETRARKISFKSRAKAVTRLVLSALNVPLQEIEQIMGDNDWTAVITSVKVRDRLAHPKRREDILVADADILSCRTAMSWCDKVQKRIATACAEIAGVPMPLSDSGRDSSPLN